MVDESTLGPIVQFGVAGLMAWMWSAERRASADRERQLTESHTRLMEQRTQLDALLKLVSDNTRAVTALESAQRALILTLRAAGMATRPRPELQGTGEEGRAA